MTSHDMKVNILMELVWVSNKSSNGISYQMQEDLEKNWKALSAQGRAYFLEWASENDLLIRVKDGRK